MDIGWPTDDDVNVSNALIAPSKLQGGFTKKRKQPEGGYATSKTTKTIKDKVKKQTHNDGDDFDAFSTIVRNHEFEPNDDNDIIVDDDDDEDDSAQHIAKKHRTVEVSAKIRPSRFKMLREASKGVVVEQKSIDPRFMDYAGKYDKKYVDKNYAFLDQVKQEEIAVLKKAAKKAKSGERKEDLRRAIQSREEQIRGKHKAQKKDELLAQYKKEQKENAKLGIAPQQINDKQLKKQLGMAQDYLSLSSNQIDKRIKHKMEKSTNRDKADFKKQGGNNKKR